MAKLQITSENFPKYLKKAESADKSLRSLLQSLLVYGLEHYAEKHNSNRLTDVCGANLHGIRTQGLVDYVEKYTDLVWTKMDDGSVRFKREAREGFEFKMPSIPWWEDSKAGQAIPKEIAKLEKQYLTTITKLVKGDGKAKLVEGDEIEAKNYLNHLKSYVPLTPDQIAAFNAAKGADVEAAEPASK